MSDFQPFAGVLERVTVPVHEIHLRDYLLDSNLPIMAQVVAISSSGRSNPRGVTVVVGRTLLHLELPPATLYDVARRVDR